MQQSKLYASDFFAWANEQASLLRAGKLAQADIEHIAEEIESMGKTEKRELVSRLTVLLLHLLKWQFKPGWSVSSLRIVISVGVRLCLIRYADCPVKKGGGSTRHLAIPAPMPLRVFSRSALTLW